MQNLIYILTKMHTLGQNKEGNRHTEDENSSYDCTYVVPFEGIKLHACVFYFLTKTFCL